jgi:hypothetical protein
MFSGRTRSVTESPFSTANGGRPEVVWPEGDARWTAVASSPTTFASNRLASPMKPAANTLDGLK